MLPYNMVLTRCHIYVRFRFRFRRSVFVFVFVVWQLLLILGMLKLASRLPCQKWASRFGTLGMNQDGPNNPQKISIPMERPNLQTERNIITQVAMGSCTYESLLGNGLEDPLEIQGKECFPTSELTEKINNGKEIKRASNGKSITTCIACVVRFLLCPWQSYLLMHDPKWCHQYQRIKEYHKYIHGPPYSFIYFCLSIWCISFPNNPYHMQPSLVNCIFGCLFLSFGGLSVCRCFLGFLGFLCRLGNLFNLCSLRKPCFLCFLRMLSCESCW